MTSQKEEIKKAFKEVIAERDKAFKEKRHENISQISNLLNKAGNYVFLFWVIFSIMITFIFSNLALMLIFIEKGITNLSIFGLVQRVFGFLLALSLNFWVISWGLSFLKKKSEAKK